MAIKKNQNDNIEVKNGLPQNVETRVTAGTVEILKRQDGKDSRQIRGYAAVFEKWSHDFGWFREKIARGAFDEVNMDDVIISVNHNFDNLLGRSSNAMTTLTIDDKGLFYEVDVPNTTIGNDVLTNIELKNIVGSSFMFTVKDDIWVRKEEEDVEERIVTKIGTLFELGPVADPAYPDSTAARERRDRFYKVEKREEEKPTPDQEQIKVSDEENLGLDIDEAFAEG